MSDLDDKLDVILQPWLDEIQSEYSTGINDEKKRPFVEFANAKVQIKQAFADNRYVQIPDVLVSGDEGITVNNERVMTGQEWYERFKTEMMTVPHLWATNDIPHQLTPYGLQIYNAAKRAAGIADV